MLFTQVDDGAQVTLVTSPPVDRDLSWMERLDARGISIFLYPRLHTKLYAFFLDDQRLDDPALRGTTATNLVLIGSANFTKAGLGISDDGGNEEVCYALPQDDCVAVTAYVSSLLRGAFDLASARVYKSRNNWSQLEKPKWR